MNNRAERRDNPAVLYKSKTKGAKSQPLFNLIIKAAELPKADKDGNIRLTGFMNSYKTKAQHPDVLFYPPRNQTPGSRQSTRPEQADDESGNDFL